MKGASEDVVEEDHDDHVPRSARGLVSVVLVALLVPGLVGFELWPMTAWRLFSLVRSDSRTAWVLEAADADGSTRLVSLEELPLPYRQAEWRLRGVRTGSEDYREEICTTLGEAVAEVEPGAVELRVARDRQQLVTGEDGWGIDHDLEVFHACDLEGLR